MDHLDKYLKYKNGQSQVKYAFEHLESPLYRKMKRWVTNLNRLHSDLVVVILGGSGAGKTTLLIHWIESISNAEPVTITTSRPKRPEENSSHYRFVPQDVIETFEAKGYLLNHYDTKIGRTSYAIHPEDLTEGFKIIEADSLMLDRIFRALPETHRIAIVDLGASVPERVTDRGNPAAETERRLAYDIEDRKRIDFLLENYAGRYFTFNPDEPTYLEVELRNNNDGTVDLSVSSDTNGYRKIGGSAIGAFLGNNPYVSPLAPVLNWLKIKYEYTSNDFTKCGIALEDPILERLNPEGFKSYTYEEYRGDMFIKDNLFLGLVDGYNPINGRLWEVKTHYSPTKFTQAQTKKVIEIDGESWPLRDGQLGIPKTYLDQVDLYMHLWNEHYHENPVDRIYVAAYYVDGGQKEDTLKGELYIKDKQLKIYEVLYNAKRSQAKIDTVRMKLDRWVIVNKEHEKIVEMEDVTYSDALKEEIIRLKKGELDRKDIRVKVYER